MITENCKMIHGAERVTPALREMKAKLAISLRSRIDTISNVDYKMIDTRSCRLNIQNNFGGVE